MSLTFLDTSISKEAEKELKKKFSVEFGEYLHNLRKEKGITQEELADKANLHSKYIGHIETGTYTPSIFVVWKISQVLKMELGDMLRHF